MLAEPLLKDQSMPMVFDHRQSGAGSLSLSEGLRWAAENSGSIQELASRVGVVLIRGVESATPDGFRAMCQAIEPGLRPYTGGDSPRTGLADKVYTSTEYDPALEVYLHNELSYAGWSPRLVFFGCLLAAETGGETQIADGRRIYHAIPADIRDRFEARGVAYLQHLWDADGAPGIGKSWQETFGTTDRAEVEAFLTRSNMTWDWTDFGIRTRAAHPAVMAHPVSGETCWRNQADQWHRDMAGVKTSFGDAGDPRFDPATAGEESLGNHVTFGDGGEIDVADLVAIRQAAQSVEVTFPWQAGDVMVVDNILAMHGRKPFTGPRRIVVAMA